MKNKESETHLKVTVSKQSFQKVRKLQTLIRAEVSIIIFLPDDES